jgi:transcriptional regulator with XRE-family HTH domain
MRVREEAVLESENGQSSYQASRIDQHVGERIRRRRTLMGFTQEQLADTLEISYQQIQKYETGTNRVSAGRLFQIAQRLDVDVAWFFEGLETAQAASTRSGGSNRATIELVRNFSSIQDPSVRTSVASLVKALSGNGDDPTHADDARSYGEFASK